MSQGTKSAIKYVIIIAALIAAVWLGLKWFGGIANDNAGKVDGGKSQAEQRVDEYANG